MNVYQRRRAQGDLTYSGRYTDPHTHERKLVNLGTVVKKEAEKRLRDLYAAAQARRFDAVDQTKIRPGVATLAQVLAAFDLFAGPRLSASTRKGYKNALLHLVRATLGPEPAAETRSAAVLTPDLVLQFQNLYTKKAGEDREKQDHLRASANSIVRNARAIFSRAARASYQALTLPASLDAFLRVAPLDQPSASYRPPSAAMIEKTCAALAALRATDRNAYLGFLLAYGAGLRRNEIAHARWTWLTTEAGRTCLNVGTTADFRPKGRDARTLPLEPFIVDELAALRLPALPGAGIEDFILAGNEYERKESTFRRLAKVMRAAGWTTHKAAHELRKMYGSTVATTHGLFAAQKLLGHKDPGMTSRYYAGLVALPEVRMFSAAETKVA